MNVKFCPKCKKQVGPIDRTCPHCFNRLASSAPGSTSPSGFNRPISMGGGEGNQTGVATVSGQSGNPNNVVIILGLIAIVVISVFSLIIVSSGSGSGEDIFKKLLPRTALIIAKSGAGTGSLISFDKKLVLTAWHVIEKNSKVFVYFPHYSEQKLITDPNEYHKNHPLWGIPADVVYENPGKDIALLRLEKVPDAAKEVILANQSPEVGSKVFALGQSGIEFGPSKIGGTLWRQSSGSVRQVYITQFTYPNNQRLDAMVVETQTGTNQGDSGGPLFDTHGNLVAIVSGMQPGKDVNYNVDITEIRKAIEEFNKRNPPTE